jgi:hypothetical protein
MHAGKHAFLQPLCCADSPAATAPCPCLLHCCLSPPPLPACTTRVPALFPALLPKAIEKKGANDTKEWAEYWVVLSTFYVTQWAIDFVLCWLPFYYIAKLGFILALWHPSTRVAQSLYQKVLSPLAITYEADIDRLHQDLRVKTAGGCWVTSSLRASPIILWLGFG